MFNEITVFPVEVVYFSEINNPRSVGFKIPAKRIKSFRNGLLSISEWWPSLVHTMGPVPTLSVTKAALNSGYAFKEDFHSSENIFMFITLQLRF